MHFGINTFLFYSPFQTAHLDLLKTFGTWGFNCAEIAIEDPALLDPNAIKKALDQSTLSHLITCGAYGPGRDLRGSLTEQQAAMDYTTAILNMMPVYGSTLFCGPLYSAVGHAADYSETERKAQQERVAGHLFKLSALAESKGIRIAMEVLNRFETDFINTAEQAVDLVERVNHPALGIHLDTFHMNIEESSFREAIRTAGPHLFHLHACANNRGTPGKGNIPWKEIRDALLEVDYNGDLVIESFSGTVQTIKRACCVWRDPGKPESIARNGLTFLRSVFHES